MLQVYGWTGENNYIVRGGTSSLVVGSSQGHFGLWLDENFNMGRSMAVSTFRYSSSSEGFKYCSSPSGTH
jgi:hypothetical protein